MATQIPRTYEGLEIRFPSAALEMDFVFCEHGSPADLPTEFGMLASQADIVAVETVGWTARGVDLRQRISNGDPQALKEASSLLPNTPQGAFWKKLHKKLFSTQAEIHYPDAPERHPVATAYITATQKDEEAKLSYYMEKAAGYPISPGTLLPQLRKTFAAIAARDRYIAEHLFPESAYVRAEGSIIRYVSVFGLLHRGLANIVRQQAEIKGRLDINIRQHESGSSDPTPYERYLHGIAPTANDVIVAFNLE